MDEAKLEGNLQVLAAVRRRAGVKILLAQKAFSCFDAYPLAAKYLDGTTASGLFEARLAHEEMPGKENHVFAPAFRAEDMPELLALVNHIVFNSPRQVERFGAMARAAGVSVHSFLLDNRLDSAILHFTGPIPSVLCLKTIIQIGRAHV